MKPAANSKLAFSCNHSFIFLFAKNKTELKFRNRSAINSQQIFKPLVRNRIDYRKKFKLKQVAQYCITENFIKFKPNTVSNKDWMLVVALHLEPFNCVTPVQKSKSCVIHPLD